MKQLQVNLVTAPQTYPAPEQDAPKQGVSDEQGEFEQIAPKQVVPKQDVSDEQGEFEQIVPKQVVPKQGVSERVVSEQAANLPPLDEPSSTVPNPAEPEQGISNQDAPASEQAVAVPGMDHNRESGEKALPRIAIHAFCQRSDTAATIQSTTQDWRMARANLKVYMGGLPAAIEYYRNESTPALILFESDLHGSELFAQLKQLASVCDADTKVVMIGTANDIRLYRDLMEQGLSEYLVSPFHPLTLIRSISDLYTDPDKPFVGKVVAFFGAKGGAGSSTIAHNIAWGMASKMLQETALVDMDTSWGTAGLDFNYDSSKGLEEALADPSRLDETLLDRIMVRHTEKLSILPAAASLGVISPTSTKPYEALVNGMRGLSPMTILDMPHIWSNWSKQVLMSADEVVITATPDLANLRNAKNLIEFLKAARPNDLDPLFILNKTGVPKTAEIPVKDFATAIGVHPALVLAYEPVIYTQASNDGKMLSDLKAAQAAFDGMMHLAQRLKTGEFPQQATGKKTHKSGKKQKKKGGRLFSLKKRK